ncbi:hypothetical protein P8A21_40355 (plasmid) [Streptomyces poriferorum]|uniref:hypothetical protein n=1 Tax=Streptomyces poriferorum TaxID=2798799 RepID=UPI00273FEBD0|nr:hypothetical protein [Streptomyces sp. Alt1]WLQ53783.1 hypothetical protein P8A21_40355 [Streptomyces sp. Alt1]
MTTTATPTAKRRKTRTRTKRVSNRPAIVVSKLLPNLIDLLPGTESLVCPDCETWCPITGQNGATPKLVPHHTNSAGTSEARRCSGSNRRVLLDLTIPQWHQLLADAIKETSSRRATKVLRKPRSAPALATSQMTPPPITLETTRKAYRAHTKGCGTCTGQIRCAEGRRLAETYVRVVRQEPRRQQIRAAVARERARFDRLYVARAAKSRAAEWAMQAETKVKANELAKKAGTAAEEFNNVCRIRPVGALSEFRGPHVPLTHLRIAT